MLKVAFCLTKKLFAHTLQLSQPFSNETYLLEDLIQSLFVTNIDRVVG